MLIEQIIKFQLSRPRPPGRICTPKLGILMTKQKFSQKISFSGLFYYLLPKY